MKVFRLGDEGVSTSNSCSQKHQPHPFRLMTHDFTKHLYLLLAPGIVALVVYQEWPVTCFFNFCRSPSLRWQTSWLRNHAMGRLEEDEATSYSLGVEIVPSEPPHGLALRLEDYSYQISFSAQI